MVLVILKSLELYATLILRPFDLDGKNYYFCSGYSKDKIQGSCDFIIKKELLGAKISVTEMKKMLSGKPSKEFSFKKANGDTFKSPLTITNTGDLVFGTNKEKKGENKIMAELNCVCPECGGKIIERDKGFFCENSGQNGSCNFVVWKESNGATYTAEDVETLVAGGTVEKTWFKHEPAG